MMKLILFLVCGVIFLQNFAFSKPDLNNDGIVGVSQGNLEEYITKAIDGFKYVILQGNEELNYPVMDPYRLEPFSWEYVDSSGSKKYRLNIFNINSAILKGLSQYTIYNVKVSAKDMKIFFRLQFENLQTELPYKLDGYLLKYIIPVYGEGIINLSGGKQLFSIIVDLGTDREYITVEDVQIAREIYHDINVKVTGFMDLSDSFASALVDGILDQIVTGHTINKPMTKFARSLVEESIGGMTIEELFELLDHFVKKNDQH